MKSRICIKAYRKATSCLSEIIEAVCLCTTVAVGLRPPEVEKTNHVPEDYVHHVQNVFYQIN